MAQGIGLPLEEALRFWRSEFAARVPGDKFDKEYAYNVRHSYGKEGKKANYTPWGCLKIVQMTPNQVRGLWFHDDSTLHAHRRATTTGARTRRGRLLCCARPCCSWACRRPRLRRR